MDTTATAQLERWQRFRTNRNKALATRHGWLTLTSFQWLESRPAGVDLAPASGQRTARRRHSPLRRRTA
ncbi:conserved hypothetical protein [Arthrobacter sp. Hiyo4]|nr:conserved hypothetical protein [Arthrobacter sp. Hiyo4]